MAIILILWKLIEDYAVSLKRIDVPEDSHTFRMEVRRRFMNVRTGTTMYEKKNSQPTKEKSSIGGS